MVHPAIVRPRVPRRKPQQKGSKDQKQLFSKHRLDLDKTLKERLNYIIGILVTGLSRKSKKKNRNSRFAAMYINSYAIYEVGESMGSFNESL